ncbi:NAD(P)-dependent dehydrogenase (short-subunit alcohol dehydrogenase family) [Skermanella aerolata]|jgi:NAD(P)-dependent dehydrogenase (short-subunit alcohol dehydrogenase family)|uniref:Short-chain dehydrogenase n=1 Tax=Skermanella aerolata TaxID=393310 RepID=A0A512E0L2_9PROT|nr:SDR family NAD(P)-dependent oxidoreductase [Skermanella aerolata]KJB90454.1 3-oxoacyl-ACP reductase [Skermanella aerolata KACC 11604]GEO42254.1 short-chain dehydrogenase [Skermanella aerolata]
MLDFGNRTVVVTGAGGNLGSAVAHAFEAHGANLALFDRDRDILGAAFGAEDDNRLLLPVDLLDRERVRAATDIVMDRFGRIDVLCNIAGGFHMGDPVHETSDRTWDFLMDVNARTLIHATGAVAPHMLKAGRGRIVNVGANAATRGVARMGAYCAAKSAVTRLTEAMSAELREHGVNVNCVLPSIIDTPENRAAMPKSDPRHWVAPEDLASVILFLSSDAARAVHGAAIPVTGLS